MGKSQRMGILLSGAYAEAEVPDMIKKVMLWFKENAYAKERLVAAIDRIGTDTLALISLKRLLPQMIC